MRRRTISARWCFSASASLVAIIAALNGAPLSAFATPTENALAVINAGVSTSEDGPLAGSDYRFAPGDYLYFSFEIAGFAIHEENRGETRKIALTYEVTPQDAAGRALTEPARDEIRTELSPEDKNWVPKRRVSFVLPSFLAAGTFRIHVEAKDEFAKQEASRDVPFLLGGVHLTPTASIAIENFRFLRREDDAEALSVPAYSAGDTVFARFDLVGFQNGPGNQHHITYGVTVTGPDGKALIKDPKAADLDDAGFYPAQFVPGNLALKMGKKNIPGQYIVIVKARDVLANTESEAKQPFSIE